MYRAIILLNEMCISITYNVMSYHFIRNKTVNQFFAISYHKSYIKRKCKKENV